MMGLVMTWTKNYSYHVFKVDSDFLLHFNWKSMT